MRHAIRKAVLSTFAAVVLHAAPAAAAEERTYAIVVGYNGAPSGSTSAVEPLRFADDDALAFFAFAAKAVRRGFLLTVVDADTQRRLGANIPSSLRPPSLIELRGAVAEVRRSLEQDARDGARTTVYVYYSGHGTAAAGQAPALAMLDGPLTRETLYDEVLAALPATRIHLFIDACHAEAVVRPRDAEAAAADLSRDDRTRFTLATTLARFPNVGAAMASTPEAEADEWELYQGGVFTHELLSGLRGAADVNGDGRVEYSELAAYLSAANREVRDPRAHIDAVVHPLTAEPRAAIVDLQAWGDSARLEGRSDRLGAFYVEDELGNRIADVHVEAGQTLRLIVPDESTLFVRTAQGEASLRAKPGERVELASLTLHPSSSRPRGAIETALHEGLFATAFGPSYYRGFVDRANDFVPVPVSSDVFAAPRDPVATDSSGPMTVQRVLGWSLLGAGLAAAGAGGVLVGVAKSEDERAAGEPQPSRASDSANASRIGDVATVIGGVGIAAAASGLVLLLTAPRASVAVSASATGLQLRGSF